MTRSELREAVFLLLFRSGLYTADELNDQIDDFFSGEDKFTAKEYKYVKRKVIAISAESKNLDNLIDKVSTDWKTKRMSKVDLTILRLACYEIKYDDSVPAAAAINEAVELAKMYGMDNSASFINGILAGIVRDE